MPRRRDNAVDPGLLRRSGLSGWEGRTGANAAGSLVLAVDEDAGMRKLVRRILESAGFGCIEAVDGESGLKLAVEARVSAAVVDLVLPGMSGAELAWRLCKEIPGIPVVAMSGRLDLWDTDDLRDLGILEALPKPFEPNRLVRAVADALAHRAARPPRLRGARAKLPPGGEGPRAGHTRRWRTGAGSR